MTVAAPPRYRLVLPPGFVLYPVRDKTDAEIAAMVRAHYRSLPRDSYGPRIDRAADQLLAVVRPAREASVIDLVVPMGVPWRAPVSMGIALSVVSPPAPADEAWAATAGDRVETQAGPAAREARYDTPPADPAELGRLATVQYTWRIPGDESRLLTAVYTISGSSDPELAPIAAALEELCDLILESLRWDPVERTSA